MKKDRDWNQVINYMGAVYRDCHSYDRNKIIELAKAIYGCKADSMEVIEFQIRSMGKKGRKLACKRYCDAHGIINPDTYRNLPLGKQMIASQPKQFLKLPQNTGIKVPAAVRSPTENKIREFYASWEWKRLSYDVKQERGRTCECCGARAPKVTIHTDHIKPLRKCWHLRLERTNMQILCEDCNMGKGSRDETDFRALNALDIAPVEPALSEDEAARLVLIKDQLRLN